MNEREYFDTLVKIFELIWKDDDLMNTFKFRAIEKVTKYIEVEAETEDEAIDIADELLCSGEIDFDKDIDYHAEIELI